MLFMQIENARLAARRDQLKTTSNLLGLIIGQLQQTRKTDDQSVLAALNSTMKGINERLEKQYNADDVALALEEKEVISQFLPKEITQEQFNQIVNGKSLMDLHRVMGPNINALAGKLMGQISNGVKEGAWSVADPKKMKEEITIYVKNALEAIV
ncbi:tRNA amidotransferase [Aeromonas phage GomatiRiver_11]|nr:hypothetical protein OBDJBBDK_00259 [Aeromonas phage AhFM11]WKW84423.1 tRNA amidotransferase [Aeromonas phage GomatiRiver_11]